MLTYFLFKVSPLWSPARTDLSALGHHAKVELGVDGLSNVGQDVDIGFDTDSAVMAQATSVNLHDHISTCIQYFPISLARSPVS